MLRSSFFVFIAGWIAWFWMDKPRQGQFRMPQVSDSLLDNFQNAFNLMKAGYPDMAFVYIWNAHYIILSLLGGMLVAVLYGGVSDYLGRRRMRRHFVPPQRSQPVNPDKPETPGSESTPAE